ncbi:MAG: hypothetical protein EKK63_18405 [Acinetobacter sp.]|uniref:DNA methyltransferase n=1 Tax=Acinetobacter sp. TaxID=472 RepID=UPI000F9B114C|nr:DNA methyltransferase [Acinetobacter sp.]RUP36090.1 MAG: hypothetical protein EKK63_18405 [Acinetobacter sp.]
MAQKFKSIYLNDKKATPLERSVTLAFGAKDHFTYDAIKDLSSVEIRELLSGLTYSEIERKASARGLSFNSYCLNRLKASIEKSKEIKSEKLVDPIHTTFRGGVGDPLHDWYPYLEGYSPDFVNVIIDKYMPSASTIYDPFSGSGTTPVACARRKIKSMYSEVNPVMQVISEAKIGARQLDKKHRDEVIKNLIKLLDDVSELLKGIPADTQLETTFTSCFGDSKFFDSKTYNTVLRARTLVDIVNATAPETAKFLLVAILRALVPSSLLQRAGDLRYKTEKELATKKVSFVPEIKSNLERIIKDLSEIEFVENSPLFVTENAKNIDKISDLKISGVITSPPYLNGTNYFRNTKIELWFIRGITSSSDLSAYRARAVTAGINDVTARKNVEALSPSLTSLVEKMEQNAYDSRIPKMVHYYFIDMIEVFRGLKSHLVKGATVAIDIGDSVYSGIHVPTDLILTELLEKEGYELVESVVLRKRTSRSGQTLRQVLLVLKFNGRKFQATRRKALPREWDEFKEIKPYQQHPFNKRNWGHPLHSLCSYQGKMKPSIAHFLADCFIKRGDRLLDPFSGVGTIPFEAALMGAETYGFDISPAAVFISRAKLGSIEPSKCRFILNELSDYIKKGKFTTEDLETAKSFGYNRKLEEYYNEKTLKEIVSARNYFKSKLVLDDNESLVLSCLLHILHGNRPYALSRRSHSITPFAPTGDYEYRALIPRLEAKLEKSLATLPDKSYVPGKVFFQDVTATWPSEVDNLDAIITSPPFFDSTRFYSANWLRLWFSGWEDEDFKNLPKTFIDERQKRSFDVYQTIFRQCRERLKRGGVLVLHLGKSKKSDMALELAKTAEPWFKVLDVFSENVEHTESHGIRDKGTVVEHQYLILG